MTNYKNLRRQTCRLQSYDYSSGGYYFVTICTHEKRLLFGEIKDEKMELSEIGKIAETELLKTTKIRENVEIDSYCVMPNHIHAIIVICSGVSQYAENKINRNGVSQYAATKYAGTMESISPKSGSLSAVVRSFKSAVTKSCRENDFHHFGWQPRFYEHIVRNEKELCEIRKYIENNPLNWELDDNFI